MRWVFQSAAFLSLIAICLFFTSGQLDWLMAWVYLAMYATFTILTGKAMHHKHPDLMAEHTRFSEDTKSWDRLLIHKNLVAKMEIPTNAFLATIDRDTVGR